MRPPHVRLDVDPVAYFLTWTTYGSWLPGDARGWVDSRGGIHAGDTATARSAAQALIESPVSLDDDQRCIVAAAITKVCLVRHWRLHAVSCRTQHVHAVVTARRHRPEEVLKQLKAWGSRALAATAGDRGGASRQRWWTEGGSRRWVFDVDDLMAVMTYVNECQDRIRQPEAGSMTTRLLGKPEA